MYNKLIFIFFGLIIAAISALIGFFCLKYPAKIINFQQNFYARINWRIEPISMEREIKNTKNMGVFMLVCGILSLFLILFS